MGSNVAVEACSGTMNRTKLRELISAGESSTVEFKRKFTSVDKFAREMIAFANTEGGYLIVGVDDDRRIVGVESEKEERNLIEVALHHIAPVLDITIDIVEIEYVDIVVVLVPRSSLRPHWFVPDDLPVNGKNRKAFIRRGEESVEASREMVKVLRGMRPDSPPMTLSIGDREQRLFAYLERYGRASVNDFARLVNISRRRASQILVKLVRAGVLHVNYEAGHDFFTLV